MNDCEKGEPDFINHKKNFLSFFPEKNVHLYVFKKKTMPSNGVLELLISNFLPSTLKSITNCCDYVIYSELVPL